MDAFRPLVPLLAASIPAIPIHLAYGGAYLQQATGLTALAKARQSHSLATASPLFARLQDTSVRLEGSDLCAMELRRRGEVSCLSFSPEGPYAARPPQGKTITGFRC
jgi:hypothetical protein